MLEGESDNVLDSFDGNCERVPWETFANDHLDAAQVITRVPMVLAENLLSESRKR